MKVKILKNFRFAHEGIHVREYRKDDEHDVKDSLAERWISEGLVKKVEADKAVNKRVEKEIENKSISPDEKKTDSKENKNMEKKKTKKN